MKVGFFHVDVAGATPRLPHAQLLIESVRRSLPGVAIVHMTDDSTPAMPGVDDVRRGPAMPIALGCLTAYAAAGAGDWLFVDTDVIVQRDVRWIFDKPFDIAVADRTGTLRPKEVGTKFMAAMPYNKGAVFSRSPAFWRAATLRLCQLSTKRQGWMGDQHAMCDVIAAGQFQIEILDSRYNYAPHRADEDLNSKAIVHFKGPRKAWMLERPEAGILA